MTTDELSLSEGLFLLSVQPVTGRLRCSARVLQYGVAAAALATLEAAGRVAEDGRGHISVVDPRPTGEPVADHALAALIHGGKAVRARRWIGGRPAAAVVDACAQLLAARGLVRIERRRALGLVRTASSRRYVPVAADRAWSAAVDFQAAAKLGFPAPRDRMLAALADVMKLGRALLPGGGAPKQARATMRQLARGHWAPRAVAQAMAADSAAASGG